MSTYTTRFAARIAVNLTTTMLHGTGDHWVQTSHQAQHKGHPGDVGRRACTAHCATYTATLATGHATLTTLAGMRLHPLAAAAGHMATYAGHYVMDRSRDSGRFIDLADQIGSRFGIPGKRGYWDHGGRYELDQAWHTLCLAGWAAADAAIQASLDGKNR